MNTLAIMTALSATLIVAAAPASAQMSGQISGFKSLETTIAATGPALIHKTSRRRGRIAAGVALGVLGIIAAGQARAHYIDRDNRYEKQCRRWRRWCREGEDRACWKYDNRC